MTLSLMIKIYLSRSLVTSSSRISRFVELFYSFVGFSITVQTSSLEPAEKFLKKSLSDDDIKMRDIRSWRNAAYRRHVHSESASVDYGAIKRTINSGVLGLLSLYCCFWSIADSRRLPKFPSSLKEKCPYPLRYESTMPRMN